MHSRSLENSSGQARAINFKAVGHATYPASGQWRMANISLSQGNAFNAKNLQFTSELV